MVGLSPSACRETCPSHGQFLDFPITKYLAEMFAAIRRRTSTRAGEVSLPRGRPGLSWAELVPLAEAAQNSSEDPTDSTQRLLSCLRCSARPRCPAKGVTRVARALPCCCIRSDAAEELAAVLVSEQVAACLCAWSVVVDETRTNCLACSVRNPPQERLCAPRPDSPPTNRASWSHV